MTVCLVSLPLISPISHLSSLVSLFYNIMYDILLYAFSEIPLYQKIYRHKKILGNYVSEICNDIPCNRLHGKMFGELIAEDCTELSPTSIAH